MKNKKDEQLIDDGIKIMKELKTGELPAISGVDEAMLTRIADGFAEIKARIENIENKDG